MKKVLLISALVLAFTVFMAAQTGSAGGAGSTSNQTGAGASSQSGQSGAAGSSDQGTMGSGSTSTPDQTPQAGTSTPSDTASSSNSNASGKTEKITGCLSQSGGQYMISDKKHPNGVQLDAAGQDLSAHIGHKVEVKGTWEAAPSSSASTSGSTGATGTTGGTTGATGETSASAGTSGAGTSGSVSGNAGASSGSMGASSSMGTTGEQVFRVESFKHKSDKCEMNSQGNATSGNPTKP